MQMNIRKANINDLDIVSPLIAKFRVVLKAFKGIKAKENIDFAKEEFTDYLNNNYPIYLYLDNDKCVGYLVCRIDNGIVWVESIYVLDKYQRKGIGSSLFNKAEELALSLNGNTLYNYVHPNNEKMINFLIAKGYNVLNLIELRKKYPNEITATKIKIGKHEFDY